MTTTRETLARWYDEGLKLKKNRKKATHMAIFVDTFDHEDFPVYIYEGQNARRLVKARLEKKNSMLRLMEVYYLGGDKAAQLKEHRSMNYGPKRSEQELLEDTFIEKFEMELETIKRELAETDNPLED